MVGYRPPISGITSHGWGIKCCRILVSVTPMPPQQNLKGPTAQHTSTAKQNSTKPSTLRNLNRRDRNYATAGCRHSFRFIG